MGGAGGGKVIGGGAGTLIFGGIGGEYCEHCGNQRCDVTFAHVAFSVTVPLLEAVMHEVFASLNFI